MPSAKIVYFNWNKVFSEDERKKLKSTEDVSLGVRINCCGELIADRPDLYDYVGDINYDVSVDPETVCDHAFRAFNRVEEGDMVGLKIRSMSVGDVVLFPDSRMFVVQGMGWKEIPAGIDKLAFWARPKVEEQV